MREQIASAFESQSMELETAHVEIQSLRNALQTAQTEQSMLRMANEQTRKDEALTSSALQRSEARAIEIERRAEDLHGELERAHTELSELRNAQLVYRQRQDEKVNQLSIQVTQLEQQSDAREKDLRHTIDALNRATANFQKRIDLVSPPNNMPPSTPAKSRSPKKN